MKQLLTFDLRQVEEAIGNETTYYAGTIIINGTPKSCDGMTDRGDTPFDLVIEEIEKQGGQAASNFDDFVVDLSLLSLDAKYAVGLVHGCLVVSELNDSPPFVTGGCDETTPLLEPRNDQPT